MKQRKFQKLNNEQKEEYFCNMCHLEAKNNVNASLQHMKNVLKQREQELQAESALKYPDAKRIQKLKNIIADLKQGILTNQR